MTSEVEERPRLVMAGYGRHRSQWVNSKISPGRGMDIYSGTTQFQKIIAAQGKASAFTVATLIHFAPPPTP